MVKKLLVLGGIGYALYYLWKQTRSETLGQYPRPRWGYRYNIQEWERGRVPPGSPRIRPRGGGYRVGTRQYYQPGRLS